jgi:hypothetical protein
VRSPDFIQSLNPLKYFWKISFQCTLGGKVWHNVKPFPLFLKEGFTMKKFLGCFLMIGMFLVLFLPLWGCRSASVQVESGAVITENPGPPPHAPAHGYRRKSYSYIYYPDCRIYFDTGRHVYFYFDLGAWRSAAVLPSHITLIGTGSVNIQMDIDTPYVKIHEHEKKYPPGKAKKNAGPGPGKAKGKSKWK